MKRCRKCKGEKPLSEFGKNKSRPDGLTDYCWPCKRLAKRQSDERHRERVRAENRDRMRRAREENPEIREKERAASERYRRENAEVVREKERERSKVRYAEDPMSYHARTAKYRAGKEQRACLLTPEDEKKIKALYGFARYLTEKFGQPYHVDHIVPLYGETCSGLHHPDNLRVIPAQLNLSKSNKIDYELVPHAFRPDGT